MHFVLQESCSDKKLNYIMADVHTKEIRSKIMATIKGKNTKPEMLVGKFLHAHG